MVTMLVAIETLLLCLLGFLLIGLLRSHASILRRLSELDIGGSDSQPRGVVVQMPSLRGVSVNGEAVSIDLKSSGGTTLLAFLSTGCQSCGFFWSGLEQLRQQGGVLGRARVYIVTRDTDEESVAKILELAGPTIPTISSSATWDAFRVPGSPYFVYLDEDRVLGQGTASMPEQLVSLLEDAEADARYSKAQGSDGASWRSARVHAILESAGIGPDHPSLLDPRVTIDEVEGARD